MRKACLVLALAALAATLAGAAPATFIYAYLGQRAAYGVARG